MPEAGACCRMHGQRIECRVPHDRGCPERPSLRGYRRTGTESQPEFLPPAIYRPDRNLACGLELSSSGPCGPPNKSIIGKLEKECAKHDKMTRNEITFYCRNGRTSSKAGNFAGEIGPRVPG